MILRRDKCRSGQTTTDYALIMALVSVLAAEKLREVDFIAQEQLAYSQCALIVASNIQNPADLNNPLSGDNGNGSTEKSQIEAACAQYLSDNSTLSDAPDAAAQQAAQQQILDRIEQVLDGLANNNGEGGGGGGNGNGGSGNGGGSGSNGNNGSSSGGNNGNGGAPNTNATPPR